MRTTRGASIAFVAPAGGGDRHGRGMGRPTTARPAVTAMVTFDAIDADGRGNPGFEEFAGLRHEPTCPLAVRPGMRRTRRDARATVRISHPQPDETPLTPDALALNPAGRSPSVGRAVLNPGGGWEPAMPCRAFPVIRTAVAAAAVLIASGCASTAPLSGDPDDAWEPANRTFYAFNDTLDRAVLEPAADLYLRLPPGLRDSVHNFFDNAAYPGTVLNQLLQGKLEPAMEGSARFVFNTTLGIGGLFDVATGFGLERAEEDFGQTLAVWGMEEGNYIHWPVLGPGSVRDTPGLVVDALTDVLTYVAVFPLALLELVDTRASLDAAVRIRDESDLDPYVFTREAYRQRRTFLIHDGNPPLPDVGEGAGDG